MNGMPRAPIPYLSSPTAIHIPLLAYFVTTPSKSEKAYRNSFSLLFTLYVGPIRLARAPWASPFRLWGSTLNTKITTDGQTRDATQRTSFNQPIDN